MIFEKGRVYDFKVSRMVCYNGESYFILLVCGCYYSSF